MTEKKEQEEKEISGAEIVFGLIGLIAVVIVIIVASLYFSSTDSERALKSYNKAVKFCGIDNIQEHNYTNGTTDFDCLDYSKLK